MLSMVVEGVFPSIYRSFIIIQDSIVTFCSYLYSSICVQYISALSISIWQSKLFHFFHITLPSSASSLYSYIISCDDSSILVYFDFLVLQSQFSCYSLGPHSYKVLENAQTKILYPTLLNIIFLSLRSCGGHLSFILHCFHCQSSFIKPDSFIPVHVALASSQIPSYQCTWHYFASTLLFSIPHHHPCSFRVGLSDLDFIPINPDLTRFNQTLIQGKVC